MKITKNHRPQKNGKIKLKRLADPSRTVPKNHPNPTLANIISNFMVDKKLSLQDFSKRSGISTGHISRLISGRRKHSPTLRLLKSISKVCGIPVEKLVKSVAWLTTLSSFWLNQQG